MRWRFSDNPKFFKLMCSGVAVLIFVILGASFLHLLLLFRPLDQNSLSSCLPHSRNEDPDRYPSVIWEAECRHQRCVNAEGKLDHHMNSVLIQQEILVLRREPENCPVSFRMEKMLVGVGCTCVSSIVRHVA
ncbi:interleukin 17A [Cricetulus griseus]